MSAVCVGVIEPSTIRTGYWCPTRALPSAVEADVLLIGSEGVSGSLGTIRVCSQCHREEFDDPRD